MPILNIIGISLNLIGTLIIGYMAFRVHFRVWKEHKIDERVFSEMKRERRIGFFGSALLIIGYVFEITGLFLA